MHYISDFANLSNNSNFSKKDKTVTKYFDIDKKTGIKSLVRKSKKVKTPGKSKTGIGWLDKLDNISQGTSELRKTISTGTRVSQELRGWGSAMRNAAREKRRELQALRDAEMYKNPTKKRGFFGLGGN